MVDTSVFDRLLDTVAEYESIQPDSCSIICGDMNARTREMPDYVIDDTQQHIPLPDDYVLDDEITPRVSQDKNGFNSNGQQLLDFCKQTSLILDLFPQGGIKLKRRIKIKDERIKLTCRSHTFKTVLKVRRGNTLAGI